MIRQIGLEYILEDESREAKIYLPLRKTRGTCEKRHETSVVVFDRYPLITHKYMIEYMLESKIEIPTALVFWPHWLVACDSTLRHHYGWSPPIDIVDVGQVGARYSKVKPPGFTKWLLIDRSVFHLSHSTWTTSCLELKVAVDFCFWKIKDETGCI